MGTAGTLSCRECGAELADEAARVAIMGLERHTCTNPAGLTFEVGCFAAAPGVEVVSNESSEWSWFPGYRWQLVACADCGTHVGWRYVRADGCFFGLIEDRLTAGASGAPSGASR